VSFCLFDRLKLSVWFFEIEVDLMFEVMITIMFWKLILWFCEFVSFLSSRICSRMLKIFGCVFLILLKRIIEYGLWCMVLVSWLSLS